MKTSALYFSPTGTSKAGAEAIAHTLDPQAQSCDLTRFDAPLPGSFGADEVVVFGAPVYSGRLYKGFAERLAQVKGSGTRCILTVTYGNRHYDDALLELSDIVCANGFIPIAAAALVAQHTYGEIQVGRPNADDLVEDRTFAEKIALKLTDGDAKPISAAAALVAQHTYGEIQVGRPNADDLVEDRTFAEKIALKLTDGDAKPISVPGSRPYREGGARGNFRPLTSDACIRCGLCARECPQGAIDPQDFSKIDDSLCLSCFRCIRRCPVGAKNMDVPAYQTFAADFSKKLSARRENEYFL